MKNLDRIINKINENTAAEISEIEEKAAREINAVREEADNRISDIRAQAEKTCEREEERIISRARSAGEMRRREILLGAKVGMIDKAFDTAKGFLLNLPPDQYKKFLAHLLADAVEERIANVLNLVSLYGDSEEYSTDFTVVFNENDKEKYAKDVIKAAGAVLRSRSESKKSVKLNLADDTAPIEGGLILRYGDIESNCSVESIISQSRADAGDAVAKALFG